MGEPVNVPSILLMPSEHLWMGQGWLKLLLGDQSTVFPESLAEELG